VSASQLSDVNGSFAFLFLLRCEFPLSFNEFKDLLEEVLHVRTRPAEQPLYAFSRCGCMALNGVSISIPLAA
jgi:hypothetical protein